ncbi:MAG: cytochrome c biogenesis protein CcsA [Candidatus Polarisedimenticolia bacterium]
MTTRRARLAPWAYGAAVVAGAGLVLFGALVLAPTERTMGDVQRIFYFHVPSATNAALAFLAAAVAGAAYLATRRAAWDAVNRAAVGTGLLFATIVLVTGPIWARPAWGAWWTWEPRLTTSLIAWLIYLGALLVRRVAADPEQGARLAAVVSIVGLLDLPIVYFSVNWWRGAHPMVFGPKGGGLAPGMGAAFALGMLGTTLLHAALFGLAWREARLADEVAALERRQDREREDALAEEIR